MGIINALSWQLNQTQVKCTCDTNDSTYILYGFLIKKKEEHLGFCLMILNMLFKNIIVLSVRKIFEMFPMQNTLQKMPGGI